MLLDSTAMLKIPLARPLLGGAEVALVAECLASGWVTQGPFVTRFEEAVRARLGVARALATTSCTSALSMALHALDLAAGSEVLAPSFTFPAPINAILHARCVPVFVDVDPTTCNLDPADLERHLTPRTRAIIAIHQFGLAADMDPVMEVAARRGLEVIEDGACALGSLRHGRPIGQHGRFTALSFHPRKIITTGEGGMLCTNDEAAAERLVVYRAQGVQVSDVARHRAAAALDWTFLEPGLNYRMSDIQAAVGCAQLERLDGILERRRAIGRRYVEAIAALGCVAPPAEPPGYEHTFQTFCCVLGDDAPVDRDALVAALRERGVASNIGAVTAHSQPAYAGFVRGPLPQSDRLAERSFLLPLFPQMEEAEVAYVLDTLSELVTR